MTLPCPGLPRQESDLADWVGRLLQLARRLQASDLHINPGPGQGLLWLRIHGELHAWQPVPAPWQQRLVSHLKVLAQMDLAERRLPQDGRLTLPGADSADIRVATLPTLHGEKLCLRFTAAGPLPAMDRLGMPDALLRCLRRTLDDAHGLILITGPTGAGKTTTLYACLHSLDPARQHIVTVEDPIERQLPGILQTNVQPRIGLGFAQVLRAVLRQDPDVLMVGEIRDQETAQIAVQAAETGHLVLSTLHTGTARDALNRLRHLGVPPYLIADTLRLVIAQRLVSRRENGQVVGRQGRFDFLSLHPQDRPCGQADDDRIAQPS